MSLPDDVSGTVLDMIKADQPDVDVGEDGTLELDLDLISTPTLWKIHGLIMQYAPEVEATIKKQMRDRESPRAVSKPAPKKKNKPMSKSEQESKIQQLQKTAAEFERQSSGSQEPVVMPTVEDSSGDESDSEEE
jgi:bromodomain-containing factor 1